MTIIYVRVCKELRHHSFEDVHKGGDTRDNLELKKMANVKKPKMPLINMGNMRTFKKTYKEYLQRMEKVLFSEW